MLRSCHQGALPKGSAQSLRSQLGELLPWRLRIAAAVGRCLLPPPRALSRAPARLPRSMRGAGGAELPRRGAAPLRGGGCALSARLSPVSRLGWVPTCVRAEARGDCVERRSGAEGCVLGVGGRPRSPPLGTRAAARTAPGGRCCLPGAGERCLRASRLGTAGAQRSSFNSFHG